MTGFLGRWHDAFDALPEAQKLLIQQRAFEAVARFCESISGSTPSNNRAALALDPAAQLLKGYEVYVRKARRYQMRQTDVREWSIPDLAKTLAWKAMNEVRDHRRRIRRILASPNRIRVPIRHADEIHTTWIATVISYFEQIESKAAKDAAVLLQYIWKHSNSLTETPKRGISFKAQIIATELTRSEKELWDVNRVQRARRIIVDEMSKFDGRSVGEIVRDVRLKMLGTHGA